MNTTVEPGTSGLFGDSLYFEIRNIHERAWEEHRLDPERAMSLAEKARALIGKSALGGSRRDDQADAPDVKEPTRDVSNLLAENYAIQAVTAALAQEQGRTAFGDSSEHLIAEATKILTGSADLLIRARVGYAQASVLMNQFEYDRAEATLYTVLALLSPENDITDDIRSIPELRLSIDAMARIGRLQLFHGTFPKALETELRVLNLSKKITVSDGGYPFGEAFALKNLAIIHHRLGDFAEATTALHRSIELCDMLGDDYSKISCLNNLGGISLDINELDSAVEHYTKALELARRHNFVLLEAIVLGNIGCVLDRRGRPDAAIECYEAGLAIQMKAGHLRGEASTRLNLGEAFKSLGRFAAAREQLEDALALHRQLDDDNGIATCLISLCSLRQVTGSGTSNDKMGDDSLFRPFLEEALGKISTTGSQDLLAQAHSAFYEGYKNIGNFSRALHHFELFHDLKEEMSAAHTVNRTLALQFRHDLEQSRKDANFLRKYTNDLRAAVEEAREQRALAERLANEDILTGLPNRRHGDQLLAAALEAAHANGTLLSIVFADVDEFKIINDHYSHLTGDRVLRRLAEVCQQHCRPLDIAIRYGGEELLFILPETTPEDAGRWAEGLRALVEQFDWAGVQTDLKVTLSLGVAACAPADGRVLPMTLLSIADARLYEAKKAGRNCVRP